MDWDLVAYIGIGAIVVAVFFLSVLPWLATPPRRKDDDDV